jgi:hypothetical protein
VLCSQAIRLWEPAHAPPATAPRFK